VLNTLRVTRNPIRERFEAERRRSAFLTFLPATGVGIIASDTWVGPWAGIPGGLVLGGAAYALVYSYETLMWRRHHGR
jgi:hypothetical protein